MSHRLVLLVTLKYGLSLDDMLVPSSSTQTDIYVSRGTSPYTILGFESYESMFSCHGPFCFVAIRPFPINQTILPEDISVVEIHTPVGLGFGSNGRIRRERFSVNDGRGEWLTVGPGMYSSVIKHDVDRTKRAFCNGIVEIPRHWILEKEISWSKSQETSTDAFHSHLVAITDALDMSNWIRVGCAHSGVSFGQLLFQFLSEDRFRLPVARLLVSDVLDKWAVALFSQMPLVIAPWTAFAQLGDSRFLIFEYKTMKSAFWKMMDAVQKRLASRRRGLQAIDDITMNQVPMDIIDWEIVVNAASNMARMCMLNEGPHDHHEEKRTLIIEEILRSTQDSYQADIEQFTETAASTRQHFWDEYAIVSGNGDFVRLSGKSGESLSVYIFAISFGLIPAAFSKRVSSRLHSLISNLLRKPPAMASQQRYQLLISSPFVLHVLASTGRADLAMQMIQLEKFDTSKAKEPWRDVRGTLFGLSAFSISDFLIRCIAGFRTVDGYLTTKFEPAFVRSLDYVGCSVDSMSGAVECQWERKSSKGSTRHGVPLQTSVKVMLLVPPNTSGVIRLRGVKRPHAENIWMEAGPTPTQTKSKMLPKLMASVHDDTTGEDIVEIQVGSGKFTLWMNERP
ncbi:hypothetical protein HDU93_002178 [Gonapodya sp. JEL0774]|nr:hypothetical protein HDU93_002178 [Gonapodya sp. JEL0774]